METDTAQGQVRETADDGTGATLGSIDRIDLLLDGVDAALLRLDDGTYGRCVTCGATIDDGVLAGEPTAERCPACAGGPEDTLPEAANPH